MKLIKPCVLLLIAISFCPILYGFPCVTFSFSAQIRTINADGSRNASKDIDGFVLKTKTDHDLIFKAE